MTIAENDRIMRFITHYNLLPTGERGLLKKKIETACGFNGATFYYRIKKRLFKEIEIQTIEKIYLHETTEH